MQSWEQKWEGRIEGGEEEEVGKKERNRKQKSREGESRRERDGGMEARMRGENDHGREETIRRRESRKQGRKGFREPQDKRKESS